MTSEIEKDVMEELFISKYQDLGKDSLETDLKCQNNFHKYDIIKKFVVDNKFSLTKSELNDYLVYAEITCDKLQELFKIKFEWTFQGKLYSLSVKLLYFFAKLYGFDIISDVKTCSVPIFIPERNLNLKINLVENYIINHLNLVRYSFEKIKIHDHPRIISSNFFKEQIIYYTNNSNFLCISLRENKLFVCIDDTHIYCQNILISSLKELREKFGKNWINLIIVT